VVPSIPRAACSSTRRAHVRFEAKGFPTHEKKFQVGPRSDDRIHYQFPVSMLVIEAPGWDGASVLIDGKFKGILPAPPARSSRPGRTRSRFRARA
jgi:hypothetical protein